MNQKVLFLCTGNSCRSQMAEGILKTIDTDLVVYSAGTRPAPHIHPKAIQVMHEMGIDISSYHPEKVDNFLDTSFDFVITVCDNANETCPAFSGSVKHRLHIGFDDPASAKGSEAEILSEFRRIRDEIKTSMQHLYERQIKK